MCTNEHTFEADGTVVNFSAEVGHSGRSYAIPLMLFPERFIQLWCAVAGV